MELLIFIGHSEEAQQEVDAVYLLEPYFQKSLLRFGQNSRSPFSSLSFFVWKDRANLGIGGQRYAITPHLERASIALFIFKERIGKGTWSELEFCRERGIPLIAIFPKNPPAADKLNKLQAAKEWTELLEKRNSLTEKWQDKASDSITPVPLYTTPEHLKEMLKDKVQDLLADIINAGISTAISNDKYDGEEQHQKQEYFNLDMPCSNGEYKAGNVEKFRSLLREEVKLQYGRELTEIQFLIKGGYYQQSKLTYNGVLLFAEKPSVVMLTAMTRVVKYEGLDKSALRKRWDLTGCIIDQIIEARNFIEENIECRDLVTGESSSSVKVFQYPMKCIREVIANAICHRDYGDSMRFVHIRIFEDRIEIANPGEWGTKKLSEGETYLISNLRGQSVLRNMGLAKAISSIDMMEMEGSGLETALTDCATIHAPEPMVTTEDGFVVVKVYPRKSWNKENIAKADILASNAPVLLDTTGVEAALSLHQQSIAKWASNEHFTGLMHPKLTSEIHVEPSFYLQPRRLQIEKEPLHQSLSGMIMEAKNHIVLTGGPGTGKTMAMKMLITQLQEKNEKPVVLQQALHSNAKTRKQTAAVQKNDITGGDKKSNKIPVLIRLRELQIDMEVPEKLILLKHLSAMLGISFSIKGERVGYDRINELDTQRMIQLAGLVAKFLDDLNALVILDGLDEIANPDIRNHLLTEISELGNILFIAKIIVTTRTGVVDFTLDQFSVVEIAALSESQVQVFVEKWFADKKRADRFIHDLKKTPYPNNLLAPIYLAYLLTIYDRYEKLPERPRSLYRTMINLLLADWDGQRAIVRGSKFANFTSSRKYDFLQNLSFELTTKFAKYTFARDELQQVYRSICNQFQLPAGEGEIVMRELETQNGIFYQSGYDRYEFSHQSIQEFLCAGYIIQLPALDESYLFRIPAELAIATSLTANPSRFFLKLVYEFIIPAEKATLDFLQAFCARLNVEKPNFISELPDVPIAVLSLYAYYLARGINEQPLLSIFKKFIHTQALIISLAQIETLYKKIDKDSLGETEKLKATKYFPQIPGGFSLYIRSINIQSAAGRYPDYLLINDALLNPAH